MKKSVLAVLGLLVAALALVAAGCGGDDDGGGAVPEGTPTALPSSSCGPIEFEGDGDPQLLIASDLPLQGSSRTQTTADSGRDPLHAQAERLEGRRLQCRLPGV